MSQKPRKRYYDSRGLGGLGGALNHASHLGQNVNRNLANQHHVSQPQAQPQPHGTIVLSKPSASEIFNAKIQGRQLYERRLVNGRVVQVPV
jgi:hypothetical protein